jgi:hypothetical protein
MRTRSTERMAPATGAFDWKGTHAAEPPNILDWLADRLAALRSKRAGAAPSVPSAESSRHADGSIREGKAGFGDGGSVPRRHPPQQGVLDMAHRIVSAIVRALRDDFTEDPAHFHAGDFGRPYVCHDARCTSPRMDVDSTA